MAGGQSAFAEDDSGPLSDINVVPLVDVVLVLLIVFMLTVPAIVGSAPIKVDLPETTSVRMAEAGALPAARGVGRDRLISQLQADQRSRHPLVAQWLHGRKRKAGHVPGRRPRNSLRRGGQRVQHAQQPGYSQD